MGRLRLWLTNSWPTCSLRPLNFSITRTLRLVRTPTAGSHSSETWRELASARCSARPATVTTSCSREFADEIGNFFSQYDAVPYDEEAIYAQVHAEAIEAQMEEAAESLAQYSAEQILKLNELVEVKRQQLNDDEEEDYL